MTTSLAVIIDIVNQEEKAKQVLIEENTAMKKLLEEQAAEIARLKKASADTSLEKVIVAQSIAITNSAKSAEKAEMTIQKLKQECSQITEKLQAALVASECQQDSLRFKSATIDRLMDKLDGIEKKCDSLSKEKGSYHQITISLQASLAEKCLLIEELRKEVAKNEDIVKGCRELMLLQKKMAEMV